MVAVKKEYLFVILIILTSFLVYSNIFSNKFILDDTEIIVANNIIKDIGNIPEIFSTDYWNGKADDIFYRPLVVLSYAFNYAIGGLNPFGYHLVNVLFHTFNSVLVFFLINLIFKRRWLSFLTALLFAVHPIHTEAVTAIAGRTELFASFFFLFALFLYIKTYSLDGRIKKSYYIWSMFLFFLALLSKESAIAFLGVLVIYDFSFRFYKYDERRLKNVWLNFKKRLKIYSGYLSVTALWILIRFLALKPLSFSSTPSFINNPLAYVGFYPRFLTGLKIIRLYLGKLILPIGLSADYSYNQIPTSTFLLEPSVIFSLLMLVVLLFFAVLSYKKSKLIFFSLSFLFFTILIISNIIIPIGTIMAERLLYLPSLGFCLLLAGLIYKGYNIQDTKILSPDNFRIILVILFILIFVFYSVTTLSRNTDWKDEQTFWLKTVEVSPQSSKAHYNFGTTFYLKQGLYKEAIVEYRKSLEIDSQNVIAYNGLGVAYSSLNLYEEAIVEFEKSIQISSNYLTYYNLGLLYLNMGLYDKAISNFEEALKINPGLEIALQGLEEARNQKTPEII